MRTGTLADKLREAKEANEGVVIKKVSAADREREAQPEVASTVPPLRILLRCLPSRLLVPHELV